MDFLYLFGIVFLLLLILAGFPAVLGYISFITLYMRDTLALTHDAAAFAVRRRLEEHKRLVARNWRAQRGYQRAELQQLKLWHQQQEQQEQQAERPIRAYLLPREERQG